MNFHMGTATGMGGGPPGAHPIMGPHTGIGACGYCILTSIVVVSFFGLIGAGFITGGGAQEPPIQAGGAAAGIICGSGAGIAPVNVPAHTTVAADMAISMNPRIPSFLTIPSSSFRQLIISV
jgi:hypothetical protein